MCSDPEGVAERAEGTVAKHFHGLRSATATPPGSSVEGLGNRELAPAQANLLVFLDGCCLLPTADCAPETSPCYVSAR